MGTHRTFLMLLRLVFALGCAFVPVGVHAQQTTAPPTEMRDPFAEVRERQRREAQLRSAEILTPADKKAGRPGIPLKQIADDFKQIQILRNNVVRHLLGDKPLDYKFVADESAEINKRAGRLAERLESTGAEDEKKEELQPMEIPEDQIKYALVNMCKRIDSFTENPSFKNAEVFDLKQAEKARKDLREVVQLSSGITKTADRLKKEKK